MKTNNSNRHQTAHDISNGVQKRAGEVVCPSCISSNRLDKSCEEIVETEERATLELLYEDEVIILLRFWLKRILDAISKIGNRTADGDTYCDGCNAALRITEILELGVVDLDKIENFIREINDELRIDLSTDWLLKVLPKADKWFSLLWFFDKSCE